MSRGRVYLAARYDRRLEMAAKARELEDHGFTVTSRWVQGLHEGATDPATLGRCAWDDLEDIEQADIFITFTEAPDAGYTSGGRHVELGYALANDLSVIVVGPAENVFHHLGLAIEGDAPMTRVDSWEEALDFLWAGPA